MVNRMYLLVKTNSDVADSKTFFSLVLLSILDMDFYSELNCHCNYTSWEKRDSKRTN